MSKFTLESRLEDVELYPFPPNTSSFHETYVQVWCGRFKDLLDGTASLSDVYVSSNSREVWQGCGRPILRSVEDFRKYLKISGFSDFILKGGRPPVHISALLIAICGMGKSDAIKDENYWRQNLLGGISHCYELEQILMEMSYDDLVTYTGVMVIALQCDEKEIGLLVDPNTVMLNEKIVQDEINVLESDISVDLGLEPDDPESEMSKNLESEGLLCAQPKDEWFTNMRKLRENMHMSMLRDIKESRTRRRLRRVRSSRSLDLTMHDGQILQSSRSRTLNTFEGDEDLRGVESGYG